VVQRQPALSEVRNHDFSYLVTLSIQLHGGKPGCIQCSSKTADLLRDAGKDHWLTQRLDVVQVKGKGEMTTFWVKTSKIFAHNSTKTTIHFSSVVGNKLNNSNIIPHLDEDSCYRVDALTNLNCNLSLAALRLIEWNLDIFKMLLLIEVVVSVKATSKNERGKLGFDGTSIKTTFPTSQAI
jgi:hypothetical protein